VRQIVHHVPDSHMNSYIRFKFALTEHEPTIKPYDESIWAEFVDAKHTGVHTESSTLVPWQRGAVCIDGRRLRTHLRSF
jgi:hypothetical protein